MSFELPERGKDIVHALYAAHRELAHGDDDQRRALTLLIAQQMAFALGPSWGTKSAGPGRPPSKDAIAQQRPDGTLIGWDLFNGATREPHENPAGEDISGQVFIPVAAVDYLGTVPPPDKPPVTPGTEPSGSAFASFDQDVRAAIGRMEHTLASIELSQAAVLAAVQASLAVALPDYGGTFTVPATGKRATLNLKPKKSK